MLVPVPAYTQERAGAGTQENGPPPPFYFTRGAYSSTLACTFQTPRSRFSVYLWFFTETQRENRNQIESHPKCVPLHRCCVVLIRSTASGCTNCVSDQLDHFLQIASCLQSALTAELEESLPVFNFWDKRD